MGSLDEIRAREIERTEIKKKCTRCKKPKLLKEYGRDKRNSDGRTSSCYECERKRKNSPAEKARKKLYVHTEAYKEKRAEYELRNRRIIALKRRKYNETKSRKLSKELYRAKKRLEAAKKHLSMIKNEIRNHRRNLKRSIRRIEAL